MKQPILEPWIYHVLIHRRERTCLLPKRIIDQYSERKIINDLKRHGVNVRIIKETHAGEDVTAITIDSKKKLRTAKRKKGVTETNYIIEQL